MRERKQYTDAFKAEAVALVVEQEMTPTQVARDLDVNLGTLRLWLDRAKSKVPEDGLNDDERGELQRLRKQNRELLMEREILKKAAVFFAKETK